MGGWIPLNPADRRRQAFSLGKDYGKLAIDSAGSAYDEANRAAEDLNESINPAARLGGMLREGLEFWGGPPATPPPSGTIPPPSVAKGPAQPSLDEVTRANRARLGQPPLGEPKAALSLPPSTLADELVKPGTPDNPYKLKQETSDQTIPLVLPQARRYSDALEGLLASTPNSNLSQVAGPKSVVMSPIGGHSETLQSVSGLDSARNWRSYLEGRQEDERARELGEAGFNQNMAKASVNPAALAEGQLQHTLGEANLANAQGELFRAQAKNAGMPPEQKAYEQSKLSLRDYVKKNWTEYAQPVMKMQVRMAQQMAGPNWPKLSPAQKQRLVDSLQEQAIEQYADEANLALSIAALKSGFGAFGLTGGITSGFAGQ